MAITAIGTQFIRVPDLPKLAIEEGLELAEKILTPNFREQFVTQPIKLTILIPEDTPKQRQGSRVFAIEPEFYVGLLEELLTQIRDTLYPEIKFITARKNMQAVLPPKTATKDDIIECISNLFNTESYTPLEIFLQDKISIGIAHKDGSHTIPPQFEGGLNLPENPELEKMFSFWLSEYRGVISSMFTSNLTSREIMYEYHAEQAEKQAANKNNSPDNPTLE